MHTDPRDLHTDPRDLHTPIQIRGSCRVLRGVARSSVFFLSRGRLRGMHLVRLMFVFPVGHANTDVRIGVCLKTTKPLQVYARLHHTCVSTSDPLTQCCVHVRAQFSVVLMPGGVGQRVSLHLWRIYACCVGEGITGGGARERAHARWLASGERYTPPVWSYV